MSVINMEYAGAADRTELSSSMTSGAPGVGATFSVASDTGYPSSGRFPVVINRGNNTEEKILISSRSGTTFTVAQRGYDGTSAQEHELGESCELAFDAISLNLLVDHVDGDEADPHSTTLLNNTRHDTTTRHVVGTAIPVGTPGSIEPDDTAAAGAAASVARSDHTHGVVAAAPGAIEPDDAAAEGVATSFARSDHTHGIAAGTPVDVDAANSEGTATSFARSDHQHGIASGVVGLTNLAAAALTALMPTGAVIPYGGTSAPSSEWLICDGSAVSRTTYADLFAVVGTAFGAGDGSTTFNLPDMVGNFPRGAGTVGATGGSSSHSHNLDTASAHARIALGGTEVRIDAKTVTQWTATNEFTASGASVSPSPDSPTSAAELGGDTFSNSHLPPYVRLAFIIRT